MPSLMKRTDAKTARINATIGEALDSRVLMVHRRAAFIHCTIEKLRDLGFESLAPVGVTRHRRETASARLPQYTNPDV